MCYNKTGNYSKKPRRDYSRVRSRILRALRMRREKRHSVQIRTIKTRDRVVDSSSEKMKLTMKVKMKQI